MIFFIIIPIQGIILLKFNINTVQGKFGTLDQTEKAAKTLFVYRNLD